jgi:hypothetical protein
MVDKNLTKANRSLTAEQYVTIWNSDNYGVTLGDLRKLVARTGGIPDKAEVHIEEIRSHYNLIDIKLAKRISVMFRDTRPDPPVTDG